MPRLSVKSSAGEKYSSIYSEFQQLGSLFRKGDVAPTGQTFQSQNIFESTDIPNDDDHAEMKAEEGAEPTTRKNHWKVAQEWFSADRPRYLLESALRVSTEGMLYLNLPFEVLKDRVENRHIPVEAEHDEPAPERVVNHVPRLNIVMLVVGTRGDVQPFIGIALKLKAYGHRVRLASHAVYREFVEKYGLEFYPLGGNPKVLSEYVVKHRGLMPTPSWHLRQTVAEQTQQLREIIFSTWPACTEPDPEHPDKPFKAELIISNPVTYGHIHCAEKLQVPLHIVFTMPWTATVEFPSPWCRVGVSMSKDHEPTTKYERTLENINANSNWTSYFFTEYVQWMGVRHIVVEFRAKSLGLKDWLKGRYASALNYAHNVRFTYIWSPSLVPQPKDWDPKKVRVVGFVDLKLGAMDNFKPQEKVVDFLAKGPPPVFIGFGSLVLDQPEKLTRWFVNAIDELGLRAIIQKGWGGLGANLNPDQHPNLLIIDGMPHDWLFPRCCAVVHHGGAGTTACGLLNGKPTFIVPFFGDQPFWGDAVDAAGVGPAPVAASSLSVHKIISALKVLLDPDVNAKVLELQKKMLKENGAAGAMASIHDHMLDVMNAKAAELGLGAEPSMDDKFEQLIQHSSSGLRQLLQLQSTELPEDSTPGTEAPNTDNTTQIPTPASTSKPTNSNNVDADPTSQAPAPVSITQPHNPTVGNPRDTSSIPGPDSVSKPTYPKLKGGAPRTSKSPRGPLPPSSTIAAASKKPTAGTPSCPGGGGVAKQSTTPRELKPSTTPRDVKSPRDVSGPNLRSNSQKFSLRNRTSPTTSDNGADTQVPVSGGQTRELHVDDDVHEEEPVLSMREFHAAAAVARDDAGTGDESSVDRIVAPATFSRELASQIEDTSYVPSRINPVTGIPSYINTSHISPVSTGPDGLIPPVTNPTPAEQLLLAHPTTGPTAATKDNAAAQDQNAALPIVTYEGSSRWARLRAAGRGGSDGGRKGSKTARWTKPWRADSEKLKVLLSGQKVTYQEPFWAKWAKFQCCTAPPKADEFGIVHVPEGNAQKRKNGQKAKGVGKISAGKHKSKAPVENIPPLNQPEQTTPQVPRPASTMVSPFAAPHMQHGWDNASSSSSQEGVDTKPFHPSSIKIYSSPDAAKSTPRSVTNPKTGPSPEGAIAEVVGGAALGKAVGTAVTVKSTSVPRLHGLSAAQAASGTDRTKGSARGSGRRQWDLKDVEKHVEDSTAGGNSVLDTGGSLELYLVQQSNGGGQGVFAPQGIMKDACIAPPSMPLTATEEIFLTHNSDMSGLPDELSAPVPGRDTTRASTGNPLGKATTPDKLGGRESLYAEQGQVPLHPALASGSSCGDMDSTRDDRPLSDRYKGHTESRIPMRPSDLLDQHTSASSKEGSRRVIEAFPSPYGTKSGPKANGTPGRKPWTPVGGPSRIGKGDKTDRDDDGLLDIAAHVMRPVEG